MITRGSQFKARVRAMAARGVGVCDHPDGAGVFFVPGTWPGDFCVFEIVKVERRYGEARLVRILETSSQRVTPLCPHQGVEEGACGGCPWMMASYESQLAEKKAAIAYQLERAGFLKETTELLPIEPSKGVFGYRNRAQFKTDGKVMGYVSARSQTIAPIEDCPVLDAPTRSLFHAMRKTLPNDAWLPGEGFHWNFLDMDSDTTMETLEVNRRRPFKQGNEAQNRFMKGWIEEQLSHVSRGTPVMELFCGSGNFTEVLSKMGFQNICASEVSKKAVEILSSKNFPGVFPVATNLFRAGSWNTLKKTMREPGVLVLDPPRAGFSLLPRFLKAFPSTHTLLYISCDLPHFIRDASQARKRGFFLKSVQPVDLFPHTPHVELLGLFKRG
ncbi:MAG: hypothetical protein MI742_15440 [Desulfobacterales bacterium]|nr:hypothetical protein [Desulfobacterales bacterium]